LENVFYTKVSRIRRLAGTSPRFGENGGTGRKRDEVVSRGDRGREFGHWWREK